MGGTQVDGMAGSGAMGQGIHATSFPLEAACVASTWFCLDYMFTWGNLEG